MSERRPHDSQEVRSLRLIYSYDGEAIRLVSTQPIAMAAPPSNLSADDARRPAYWTEVRDAQSSVLHRRALHDPVRRFVEVYPDDPAQPITHLPVDRPRGAFAVLVPAVRGADHVAVMARESAAQASATSPSASSAASPSAAPVELLRTSLAEVLS